MYLISEPIPSCLQSFYFRITRSSFPVPDLSPNIVAALERKNEEEKRKSRRGRRGDRGRMHINFHYNSVCYYCLQVVPLYFYVSLININFYLNQVTLLCLHLLFTLQKCHLYKNVISPYCAPQSTTVTFCFFIIFGEFLNVSFLCIPYVQLLSQISSRRKIMWVFPKSFPKIIYS